MSKRVNTRKQKVVNNKTYGAQREGSLGNNDVFLILSNPKNNITTLSNPIPHPACGDVAYLNESI